MKKGMKIIMRKMIYNQILCMNRLLSIMKKNSKEIICAECCKALETEEYILSFKIRPADDTTVPQLLYDGVKESVAIVLQGPLRLENHFTYNTVRYYKKMYPAYSIIVSTWEGEDEKEINAIENCGGIVIKNCRPNNGGHLNINYQLITSKAGINKAIELGAEYICKSRTDQRLCKAHIFEFILNLLNEFPPRTDAQIKRIAVLPLNYGNMFYPYFMSDFFYFGTSFDIQKLFSVDFDLRESFHMSFGSNRRDFAEKLFAPEVYIMQNYFELLGHICKFSVQDYWEAVRKYLLCLDRKMVDLKWPKYDAKYLDNIYFGEYFFDDDSDKLKTVNFDFVNWLNLYMGTLQYKKTYEKYADVLFKE